jgi:hypothetical protein
MIHDLGMVAAVLLASIAIGARFVFPPSEWRGFERWRRGAPKRRNRLLSFWLCPLLGSAAANPAWAYRPFDGTDAGVAAPGEFELELGPAQLLREGSDRTLIAPAVVLNLGVAEDWEAVLQGQGETPLRHSGDVAGRSSFVNNGLFLKGVLRDGVLQEKPGPSVATEFGVLLPGINGDRGAGASVAGVASQRWAPVTAHFNAQAALTRESHADLFLSTILEGPAEWPVRPVAEVFYERTIGETDVVSGLIGAIWQIRENLAVDAAVREAHVGDRDRDRTQTEIRLGITLAFPIWGHQAATVERRAATNIRETSR